jgi:hypothetical protein
MLEKSQAENLTALLAASLEAMADAIPLADRDDVQDYIDHGEYGVAWELLWHFAGDTPLPTLIEAGELMGFDTTV